MQTYELTYIISSQLSTEEANSAKTDVESFIQSHEGVIVKSEKTGAQPLAYTISGHSSGYFNITVFQIDEQKVKEVKSALDKNTKVLRSFIAVKKPVKIMKERRTRRPMGLSEFETKKKPSIMDTTTREDVKRDEKVNPEDLEKKLDEILSE